MNQIHIRENHLEIGGSNLLSLLITLDDKHLVIQAMYNRSISIFTLFLSYAAINPTTFNELRQTGP